jgi:hypothetical protein
MLDILNSQIPERICRKQARKGAKSQSPLLNIPHTTTHPHTPQPFLSV